LGRKKRGRGKIPILKEQKQKAEKNEKLKKFLSPKKRGLIFTSRKRTTEN